MHKAGDKCPICGIGKIGEKVLRKTFEYKHKSYTIPDYQTFMCDTCGESFTSNEASKRIEKELTDFRRSVDGLLTSHQIKILRKKLGKTQEEMATLLKVAPKTFARYENGQVTQSRIMDQFLRSLDAYPIIIRSLEKEERYEEIIRTEIQIQKKRETSYEKEESRFKSYGDFCYATAA